MSLLSFNMSNDELRVAIYHDVKSPHNLPRHALRSYESQSGSKPGKNADNIQIAESGGNIVVVEQGYTHNATHMVVRHALIQTSSDKRPSQVTLQEDVPTI
jgi:hypothetical protein